MEELAKQNFEVNLNNSEGATILKSSFNAILSLEENVNLDEYGSVPTVYATAAERAMQINGTKFNLVEVLYMCQKAKEG